MNLKRKTGVFSLIMLALYAHFLTLCDGTSFPFPDVCMQVRADRNRSLLPPLQCGSDAKVRRSFFHQRRSICKHFGVCQETADILDSEEFGTINYFRNVRECRDVCVNGPRCVPEIIDNAHPPELSQSTAAITYKCLEGYQLLGNSTLSCNGKTVVGSAPICTKVKITTGLNGTDVSSNESYVMSNTSQVLECGLDGVEEHSYPVQWTLPPQSNGGQPPGIMVKGATLEFSLLTLEQEGPYTCSIAGIEATVYIIVSSM